MGCIYLARCKVNGKGYIGKSKHGIDFRRNRHQKDAEKGCSNIFYHAIRKYGWDSFEWSILYEDDDDDQDWMDWWERKFIRELKTKVPNGYNMTDGGDGGAAFVGKTHSAETKKKIGEVISMRQKENPSPGFSGKVHTDETKQKMRNAHLGMKQTEETKLKKSIALKGRPLSSSTKEKISEVMRANPSLGFSGKVHTDETKQKIRESSLKYSRDKQGRFIKIEQV